jgi:hypothetical protein
MFEVKAEREAKEEEAARLQASCSKIFRLTADRKVSDLTKERAAQKAG